MKQVVISVVLVALGGAGGFWGGTVYQKSKLPTRPDFSSLSVGEMPTGASGANRRAGGSNGPGGLTGEITAKDDTSLTIKTSNGSTQTAYYSELTEVVTDQAADKADLKTGTKVTVTGTPNSDGSLTANTVRLTD